MYRSPNLAWHPLVDFRRRLGLLTALLMGVLGFVPELAAQRNARLSTFQLNG